MVKLACKLWTHNVRERLFTTLSVSFSAHPPVLRVSLCRTFAFMLADSYQPRTHNLTVLQRTALHEHAAPLTYFTAQVYDAVHTIHMHRTRVRVSYRWRAIAPAAAAASQTRRQEHALKRSLLCSHHHQPQQQQQQEGTTFCRIVLRIVWMFTVLCFCGLWTESSFFLEDAVDRAAEGAPHVS